MMEVMMMIPSGMNCRELLQQQTNALQKQFWFNKYFRMVLICIDTENSHSASRGQLSECQKYESIYNIITLSIK